MMIVLRGVPHPLERMRVSWLVVVVVGLAGCVRQPADLSWRFEARTTLGEVRVMPVVTAYEAPKLRIDGFVTDRIPWPREMLRQQRIDDLDQVPESVAMALPGAVHSLLQGQWSGHFSVGHFSGNRDRLVASLKRGRKTDRTLSDIARNVDGEAVLFTWITSMEADPITSEALPGEVVQTGSGPVVVDLLEEAYRVRAEVGMALVSTDGEVVLRYSDTFEAVLSPHRTPQRVGRDLAMSLAREVVKVWPVDPRLSVEDELAFRTN